MLKVAVKLAGIPVFPAAEAVKPGFLNLKLVVTMTEVFFAWLLRQYHREMEESNMHGKNFCLII